jgi:hypothetical protein
MHTVRGDTAHHHRAITRALLLGMVVIALATGCSASPAAHAAAGACDLSGTSSAEQFIILHESGGRPDARNPHSTAFGIGQLLEKQRRHYLGDDYATTDCAKQLGAFRAYVRDRYGTAEDAETFWRVHHWY